MQTIEKFKSLGFSKLDITAYEGLRVDRSMTVSRLGEIIGMPPAGLYRTIERLETMGFALDIGTYPKQYQARSLDSALEHYLEHQKQLVFSLSSAYRRTLDKEPIMKVLNSKKEIFDTYMKLACEAKQDVLIISIGEEVPEALYKIAAESLNRGIKNYLIFQRHDQQNDFWLRRWRAIGCYVKILPGEGYHLNIIDNGYAILSSSNVEDRSERTAVLINVPSVVIELRKYFFQQWQKAEGLTKLNV